MMSVRPQAVVIGASAGALDALSTILPDLPAGFPLPIMLVVHLPPNKNSLLADLLRVKCSLNVQEAEDKEILAPGNVYVAPPDYHLLVEKDKSLSLSNEEEILFSRPSIDILFESAADVYGQSLIGVILTGANDDGSRGMKVICDAGGMAVVQDPGSAAYGIMPQATLKTCPGALVLKLQDISGYLKQAAGIA